MIKTIAFFSSLVVLSFACSTLEKDYSSPIYSKLDVQGHRGCRGSLPENTLPGFIQALEWGVSTLEMDVVISKDRQVVVSHEPYMSHRICLDSLGEKIDSASQFLYNMYKMSYQEILQFDCGSISHPEFVNQKQQPGPKPLLIDVIKAVEKRTKELGLTPVKYNIETKSAPGFDLIFHPKPSEFVELVLSVVMSLEIEQRTIIQSFDVRTLQEVNKQNPDITTALLVENKLGPLKNFIQLGFEPHIYSPSHTLVNDSLVRYLHQKNIAVIPWTVNNTEDMTKYMTMGVDGIITDYPEVLLKLIDRFE